MNRPTEGELIDQAMALPCAQCGQKIFDRGRTQAFCLQDPAPFVPFFCSEECALEFKPEILTSEKLSAIYSWLPPPTPARGTFEP